jgi:hypothetical protein
MIMKMKSSEGIPPTWDIDVDVYGNAQFLEDDNAEMQTAQIASFLSMGSTPQLNEAIYPDWLGWMTGEKTFGDLDASIRASIDNAGITNHYPEYSIMNDKLQLAIKRG